MTRLRPAVEWLGPISAREAATALQRSQRQVARMAAREHIGRDGDGRYSLAIPRSTKRPCVVAVEALLDGGEVYADWLSEQTGYSRRAVYAALAELGYSSRRGRGAVWVVRAAG